eukprot:6492711-Amphidinium_carterae.2
MLVDSHLTADVRSTVLRLEMISSSRESNLLHSMYFTLPVRTMPLALPFSQLPVPSRVPRRWFQPCASCRQEWRSTIQDKDDEDKVGGPNLQD